jgi:neural Wiskott-Aldrich syndrome protein
MTLIPQAMADAFRSIPMSPNLSRSLGRAQEFAREQSHRVLLLEHLLLALTEDPDASTMLRACGVDLVRLSTDVSGYLGRLPEDMRGDPGAEPPADHELLRVLEAARQAAHQSRRRQIEGSIVLAAVVGDGKSPAAGLLKAHGMTFEEAIRALQKATAQARSKQYAMPPGQQAAAEPPAKVEKPAAPPPAEPPPSAAAPPPAAGQSVDEILAAARARIQQRVGTTAKPEPLPEPTVEPKPATKPPPREEPQTLPLMSLSSFQAAPAPPLPEMPPRLESQDEGSPADAPTKLDSAGPPPPALRSPQAPDPPPPPKSVQKAIDGLPPNLPPSAGADGQGPPRPSPRAARSQRADPVEPGPSRRSPATDGKVPPPRRAPTEMPRQQGRPPRAGQRAPAGPLVEAIPRRMRAGAPCPAQVRIGRDKIDGLMQLLMAGRAPQRPEAVIAHSLTVRLKAPDGGFSIDAATPETQWVEATPGQQAEEPVTWHWTVTPQRRGRRRLQLLVAARSIGQQGMTAETAPPDRMIEVAVAGNPIRRLFRFMAWLAVLGIGVGLGRYGLELFENGPTLLNKALSEILGLLLSSGFLGG